MRWKKVPIIAECYSNEDGDFYIFIIKTGFKDKFIVTYDDPYEQSLGAIDLMSKEEIRNKYGIEIQI